MTPLSAVAPPVAEPSGLASVDALRQLLDRLVSLLIDMPVDVYTAKPADRVSGSIGGHVRHVLDHVGALLSSNPSATLSYDHRERGTAVETDPVAAVRQAFRLNTALTRFAAGGLETPVLVKSMVTAAGDTVTGWSTLGREIGFVISHTIHHQAIIALLLAFQGREAPDRFGYAPSTPGR